MNHYLRLYRVITKSFGMRFRPQPALVGSDDGAADAQAKTQPVGFGGKKRLEQLRLRIGRHWRAVVEHVQHPEIMLPRHNHPQAAPALRAIAPAIACQIPQHLLQTSAIKFNCAGSCGCAWSR